MTQEESKKFFDKVLQMRNHQRAYFKYRASVDLEKAKKFEKEVDDLLEKELKARASGQTEMFS